MSQEQEIKLASFAAQRDILTRQISERTSSLEKIEKEYRDSIASLSSAEALKEANLAYLESKIQEKAVQLADIQKLVETFTGVGQFIREASAGLNSALSTITEINSEMSDILPVMQSTKELASESSVIIRESAEDLNEKSLGLKSTLTKATIMLDRGVSGAIDTVKRETEKVERNRAVSDMALINNRKREIKARTARISSIRNR
jgi:hypothetical protein